MVSKHVSGRDYMVGVFTTLENVYEALRQLSLNKCYIKSKTNKEVTKSSLTTGFKGRGLIIYRDQKYVYKVLQLKFNEINPYLKQVLKEND